MVFIIIDLTRTFHTVDKIFLVSKLNAASIRGPINQWFVYFFEDRKFRIKINDDNNIDIGTLQGSVLGPLMFFVFIKNLPNLLNYAKLYVSHSKYCTRIKLILYTKTAVCMEF